MTNNHPRTTRLIAAAILTLAAALRLRGLQTTALWGDQAFTLNTAMRWVNGGPMPLAANKSSVGIMNPPMIEYLYAAALRLWGDILSVSLLTVLGGLLAVAVTGAVTIRLFGRRAGLWAMLAFAVAPWAVFWSQLIWNQTMVPPFAALALGGLLLYLAHEPRRHYLVGAAAAASAMTQVHPGSAVQIGTMALALLLYRRRVNWRHALWAAAAFVLLYVPYLLYQIGTNWADIAAARAVAGQPASLSPASLLLSLDLLRAQGLFRAAPRVVLFDSLAAMLFIAALMLVVGRALRGMAGDDESTRGRERRAIVILLLWFVAPMLFYLRSSVYLQNYYLIGQWPAHFMILGIGLDTARRAAGRLAEQASSVRGRRGWAALGWLLPALLLGLSAYHVVFTIRYQDARAVGDDRTFQVRTARETIDTANRLMDEYPACQLVGVGRGHQVENSDLALLQEFTDPARIMLSDAELALPLPAPCGLYLGTRPGTPAGYWLESQARPIDGTSIPAGGGRTWQFYHRETPAAADPGSAPTWTNGAALVGYFRGQIEPGRPLDIALSWRITDEPGTAYNLGVYLLGPGETVISQQDGPGFDSIQWRTGDEFVSWHFLPIPADLPPGEYDLAVAYYTWPDLVRAEVSTGGNTGYLERVYIP